MLGLKAHPLAFDFLSAKNPGKIWFCQIQIQDKTISFFLKESLGNASNPKFILQNGKETIPLIHNRIEKDSIFCPISIFESELVFPKQMGDQFHGFYLKNKAQKLPFSASRTLPKKDKPLAGKPIQRKWKIRFFENEIQKDSGLLVIQTQMDSVYGTILSETGDYRFLNGMQTSNGFYLQTLDGGHSYRFDFEEMDTNWEGRFIYGPKGNQDLTLQKAENEVLKNPFSLTRLSGNNKFLWKAKDKTGMTIDQNNEKYAGKALVLQLMGSWCPNCLDETRFLTEAWSKKPASVEFVGLAFEKKKTLEEAFSRIETVNQRLSVPYPIYWGGLSHKDSALKAFSGVEKIMAFPTTFFVKKDGSVLKVHTGFSGPATGQAYEAWKKEFAGLLEELSQ
jgi:thiol-disulfide isomerase/thioredoxin